MLAVENLYGDLSTTRLTEITREFGCVSQASIAGTGSDVIFLSQRGIISLRQTEFGIRRLEGATPCCERDPPQGPCGGGFEQGLRLVLADLV